MMLATINLRLKGESKEESRTLDTRRNGYCPNWDGGFFSKLIVGTKKRTRGGEATGFEGCLSRGRDFLRGEQ